MRYIVIDRNQEMVDSWNKYFHSEKNVTIMQGDLTEVTVDAIVSPANSFGFMDGGVDYAISLRLGWNLQDELQKIIKQLPEGELLVGKALTIPTNDDLIPYLISAPTMRVPMSFNIATSVNAYLAMKAALIEAKRHEQINEIAIPGFCTGVGKMPRDIAANQMYQAFLEIEHNQKMDFATYEVAQKYHWRINTDGALWQK
ncbi:Appr-1-p processing protein [bacterium]|nr:Appr-1-p processing protein [bacterium]